METININAEIVDLIMSTTYFGEKADEGTRIVYSILHGKDAVGVIDDVLIEDLSSPEAEAKLVPMVLKGLTTVLWFSRHKMSYQQRLALDKKLGKLFVVQINGTAPNVHVPFEAKEPEIGDGFEADMVITGTIPPLKEVIGLFDEAAVVLPINLMQQALPFSNGRLLQALNQRVLGDDGRATFIFDRWQAVKEVKIVTEDL